MLPSCIVFLSTIPTYLLSLSSLLCLLSPLGVFFTYPVHLVKCVAVRVSVKWLDSIINVYDSCGYMWISEYTIQDGKNLNLRSRKSSLQIRNKSTSLAATI